MASAKQLMKPVAYRMVSLILRQGAQLTPERMIAEYRQGRFPMAGKPRPYQLAYARAPRDHTT